MRPTLLLALPSLFACTDTKPQQIQTDLSVQTEPAAQAKTPEQLQVEAQKFEEDRAQAEKQREEERKKQSAALAAENARRKETLLDAHRRGMNGEKIDHSVFDEEKDTAPK